MPVTLCVDVKPSPKNEINTRKLAIALCIAIPPLLQFRDSLVRLCFHLGTAGES
jgi:hypothetical protein